MSHREDDTRDVLIIESGCRLASFGAGGMPDGAGLGARRVQGGEGKAGLILAPFSAAQQGLLPIAAKVGINDEQPALPSASRRVSGLSTAGRDLALRAAPGSPRRGHGVGGRAG